MRGHVVKLPNGNYLIWSSVADAPLTCGMPRDVFIEKLTSQYSHIYDEATLIEKVALADQKGSSRPGYQTLEELIEGNCAGPGESSLTLDEIVETYGDFLDGRGNMPSL